MISAIAFHFSPIGERNHVGKLLLIPASCPEFGHLLASNSGVESAIATRPNLGQLTNEDEWEPWGFLSAAERSHI